jgi:hypothetical protein
MQILHFASVLVNDVEQYGIAEKVPGGYLFRRDGARQAVLISYRNPHLLLHGRVDLVAAADAADGDRVLRCSRTTQGVAA